MKIEEHIEKQKDQEEAAWLLDDETKLRSHIQIDIKTEKQTNLQFRYLHSTFNRHLYKRVRHSYISIAFLDNLCLLT